MTDFRIPSARLIPAALAMLVVTACGENADPLAEKLQTELDQSQAALHAAERRLAVLLDEQSRDRRRLAELSAGSARLEQRNRELEQHVTRAGSQLAQQARARDTLRRQRDQNIRRVRELGREQQALRASLARANNEARRLRARPSPDQHRIASLQQRGAAAVREIDELRRYNGFLLRERSNLQAWLEEANATRRRQQDAIQRADQEIARLESAQSEAESAGRKLRGELDRTARELATAKTSVATLSEEVASLHATAARLAESERDRNAQLEQALDHSSSPGSAHDAVSAGDGEKAEASTETAMLRAQLGEARDKVARLKIAKDYLVEKIEACTSQQQSSSAGALQLALLEGLSRGRIETVSARRRQGHFMTAQWQTGPAIDGVEQPRLVQVASESDDAAKSTRHEKELAEAKRKLKDLEMSYQALTQEVQELEIECSAVRKQVETLTWANKELVKELDTAYQSREAGIVGKLPEGTRGVYVLRQGESLSLVAKAFYGEVGRWKDIVDANKEKIPDPDNVKAGTIILIPE